ncbi:MULTISPECIES: hypothetical protein [unclassified Luteimonas]
MHQLRGQARLRESRSRRRIVRTAPHARRRLRRGSCLSIALIQHRRVAPFRLGFVKGLVRLLQRFGWAMHTIDGAFGA